MGKGASYIDRDPYKHQALLDLIPKSSARRGLVPVRVQPGAWQPEAASSAEDAPKSGARSAMTLI